ncbi:MAG: hypothetical protein H6613_09680 [Ignavibacteriales bacterium]|nr:hypothetical protein [Ignavibacteriales bacterium]
MRNIISICLLFFLFVLGTGSTSFSQTDNVYNQGTVWSLAFVRTCPNSTNDYLKGLKKTWEASLKDALKEGLIKSYKVLLGPAANQEDYNIILMIEFENMASFDPDVIRDKKWDAIDQKIKDSMKDEYQETLLNYENIRQFFGEKLMREIYFK